MDKERTIYKLGAKVESVSLEEAKEYTYSGIGKGWYGILDYLFFNFENFATLVEIFDVKEKFGGLRVYLNRVDVTKNSKYIIPNFNWLVRFVEGISFHICEKCGAAGTTISLESGWLKTLCQACNDAIKNKKI